MNYRVETKEAFDIFGIEITASLTGAEGCMRPDQLWKKTQSNGEYDKLCEDAGELPPFVDQSLCKIHAAECFKKTNSADTFSYMLFSFVSKTSKTEGYAKLHIPSQTFAVITSEKFQWSEFNNVLMGMKKTFYDEFLKSENFTKADAADFEIYGGDNEYGYLELWFPIVRK